ASGEDAPAARDRRASVRHDQGADGSDTLFDEEAATGCRRDGAARAGLQPHARYEHHGCPTTPGGDEGIVDRYIIRSLPTRPRQLGFRNGTLQKGKSPKHRKMIKRGNLLEIATPQCFFQGVFTQPRPQADIQQSIGTTPSVRSLKPRDPFIKRLTEAGASDAALVTSAEVRRANIKQRSLP